MGNEPYVNETWEQFADAQLDHTGTPAQHAIRDARLRAMAFESFRLMVRGY